MFFGDFSTAFGVQLSATFNVKFTTTLKGVFGPYFIRDFAAAFGVKLTATLDVQLSAAF